MFKKLMKSRKDKKGFTLVELIVVLVILAILAAILVPALLGWIDRARQEQYSLQARNIVLAAQTYADEAYAAQNVNPKAYVEGKKSEIAATADMAAADLISVSFTSLQSSEAATNKTGYTITTATLKFNVGSVGVTATLTANGWDIKTSAKLKS